jgi:sulfate adenylyltransferase
VYGPYDAQALLDELGAEIGVTMVPFKELVYVPGEDRYEEADRVPAGLEAVDISGTQVRSEYLPRGRGLASFCSETGFRERISRHFRTQTRAGRY